jgi:hypothetical protein
VTVSANETLQQGVRFIQLAFHIPQPYQSNGVVSIPVLVPTACVGTNTIQPNFIFYALIEETIGWLAGVGPKHSLVRLCGPNSRQHAQQFSSDWNRLRDRFQGFISSLRETSILFPGLGQLSGAFGVIEVAHARTDSGEMTMDYIVTLALASGHNMRLYLPRGVAQLPRPWMLDWLEIQIEFSSL